MRISTFDIESTALDASYGRILCACFKFDDEKKPRSYSAPRLDDEITVLGGIRVSWDECDVVVTWNGKLFDVPMVNARLMYYRMPILDPKKMHVDLLYQSKKLRFRGNRMDFVSKDLRTKTRKFDVPAEDWVKAADGQEASLMRIVKHCELDVLLTEELMERLKPLIVHITR